jgi:hypothetical protein
LEGFLRFEANARFRFGLPGTPGTAASERKFALRAMPAEPPVAPRWDFRRLDIIPATFSR